MSGVLAALFGVVPALILAVPAIFTLIAGIAGLFEYPTSAGLLVAWGFAGLAGTRTLISVFGGTYTDNSIPGLLAGIAAAAPLAWFSLQSLDARGATVVLLYLTAGPIVVATAYLADMLLFETRDDARIVQYEEV